MSLLSLSICVLLSSSSFVLSLITFWRSYLNQATFHHHQLLGEIVQIYIVQIYIVQIYIVQIYIYTTDVFKTRAHLFKYVDLFCCNHVLLSCVNKNTLINEDKLRQSSKFLSIPSADIFVVPSVRH